MESANDLFTCAACQRTYLRENTEEEAKKAALDAGFTEEQLHDAVALCRRCVATLCIILAALDSGVIEILAAEASNDVEYGRAAPTMSPHPRYRPRRYQR